MARDVDALRPMIAALDHLRVTQFADRSWCRGIEYLRGGFSSVTDDVGCIYNVVRIAFDEDANEAFSDVRRALDATGVGISDVYIQRGFAGQMTRAEFDVKAGAFDRFYYIYEPGAPLPEELPGEAEYTRIDADWYFEWEDWN